MDQIKRIRSKFSKKVSAGSKPRRDPKLRYSRSMPLRNSSDTDTSCERPHPVYRGEHPLKISDIHHVIDISPEAVANYENPQHGWPRPNNEFKDGELSDTEGPYRSRRLLIDKELVDKFPAPPTTTPTPRAGARTPKPVRPLQRPPPMNMEEYDWANDLLPELSPTLKAKMDATVRYHQDESRRERQALERRQQANRRHGVVNPSLGRSASSVSAYTRTPTYPSPKPPLDRRNAILSPSSTSLASNTMSTPATAAFYHNPTSSLSTQTLAPNARLRGHQGPPSISNPQPLAPNRHRNPSTASSASTFSHRRPDASTPPVHPFTPAQYQAGQNYDLYHPSVMRVLRGPHGATLQCPKPVRPGRLDVAALEVNDAEEGQEWGVGYGRGAGAKYYPGHKVKPMAATVAGYGRDGIHR